MKTFNSKTITVIEIFWWTLIVALFTDSVGEFIKWMALFVVSQVLFMLTIIAIARKEIK